VKDGIDVAEDFLWRVVVFVARIDEGSELRRKILTTATPLVKNEQGKVVGLDR
jgi:hypothetical protein